MIFLKVESKISEKKFGKNSFLEKKDAKIKLIRAYGGCLGI